MLAAIWHWSETFNANSARIIFLAFRNRLTPAYSPNLSGDVNIARDPFMSFANALKHLAILQQDAE